MNILKNRPLCLILCIILGVFSLFADFSVIFKTISAVTLISLFVLSFVFKDLFKSRTGFIRICLLCGGLTFILSAIWTLAYFPLSYYEKDVDLVGRVYDINDSGSYSTVITIETETINDKSDSHKIKLYLNKDQNIGISVYDVISCRATISELKNDNAFDSRSYHITYGYSAKAEYISDLEILDNDVDFLDNIFNEIGKSISNTLKKRTDFNTGAFLTALIIGDRSDLDGNTSLNFLRTGISHILALSGMHIALLSITLTKILMMLGVGKKARVAIVSLFAIFYMGLTGFSTSVSRAGIMLIITGVLYLLRAKSDSITSLFLSVLCILVISPNAAYDLALWLSAFATLGVICYSDIVSKREKKDRKWYEKCLLMLYDGCMISVFAFGATYALCGIKFDNISLISIIATLLFSFITNLLIYAGLALLIIGWLIPFGKLVCLLSGFIKYSAELLSDIQWVYASSDFIIVKIMIAVFTVFFFTYLLVDTKKQKLSIFLIAVILLNSFLSAGIATAVVKYDDEIVYNADSNTDSFLLKSNGNTSIIVSGEQGYYSAYNINDFLIDERITYINNFVLANYDYASLDFVEVLLCKIKIRRILLPKPQTYSEVGIFEGISDLLTIYGTEMYHYEKLDALQFGELKYSLFDNEPYVYGVKPMSVFKISTNQEEYTYISSGDFDTINSDARKLLMSGSRNLIIGSSGSTVYNQFNFILPDINTLFYSNAAVFDDEIINYYKEKGASIKYIETPINIWD